MYANHSTGFLDQAKLFFGKKSALPRLILINVVIFVVGYLAHLVLWLYKADGGTGIPMLTDWLAVPSSLDRLWLKPWTLFTYMFFHEDFFHLLFNMITLYFGGTIFLRYLNERQLIWTYLTGGLAGAVFYIVAYNFFPVFLEAKPFAIALGASASVLSVMIAVATYVPRYKVNLLFLGPVRLQYLAVFFILLDVFSIKSDNPGGHIAHLGGAAWGILYAFVLRNGKDLYPSFRRKRLRVKHSKSTGERKGRPLTDDEYNKKKREEQQQIDQILDKISRSGYDSLTEKEKAILFSNSRK